jgi:hypothetical protein
MENKLGISVGQMALATGSVALAMGLATTELHAQTEVNGIWQIVNNHWDCYCHWPYEPDCFCVS